MAITVGQYCTSAGVRISKRGRISFDLNIADYIEAVHADDFDAAIGKIAMYDTEWVHTAPYCRRRNAASGCAIEPALWQAELRMKMSNQLYARWQPRIVFGVRLGGSAVASELDGPGTVYQSRQTEQTRTPTLVSISL